MSENQTSNPSECKNYRVDIWSLAQENKVGEKVVEGGQQKWKLEMYDLIVVTSFNINKQIKELKEILTDKKLLPDPRFDQIADEIDNQKKEIDELKMELKRLKSEKQ